ncbi:hypothetical protein [Bacillus andreraoultii]|uniref:hypothetical protein n=1 Tax=Bacillus andreraoultii TaxID=1499685 RepID=UPI00053A5AF5|nr:hypothetical protein [Bacillus andreraoultii]
MSKVFQCNINEDILEKFQIALMLNKEEAEDVIEKCMLKYISSSFSRASQEYKTLISKDTPESDIMNRDRGKARIRIPRWAKKPNQYNHRIIRAFYQVESELGFVPFSELERRCSDEVKHTDTFVRDFRGNFYQMKIDSPKSHGKVFEVENDNVVIWEYVKEILEEYKEYFCR